MAHGFVEARVDDGPGAKTFVLPYAGCARVGPHPISRRSSEGRNYRERLNSRTRSEMHTVIVVAIGFGLLAMSALVGRVVGGSFGTAIAALIFLPLWLIGAGINMYIGVRRAGYSVADEAPIFLVVFAIPAAAAFFVWWKLR